MYAIAAAEGVRLAEPPEAPEESSRREGAPPRFTMSESRAIAAEYAKGLSMRELAGQHGVAPTTIKSALRRAGEAA